MNHTTEGVTSQVLPPPSAFTKLLGHWQKHSKNYSLFLLLSNRNETLSQNLRHK